MATSAAAVESLGVPTDTTLTAPADLAAARARRERTVRRAATAPVLHLTPEFLEALQGSWGTPEELGLAPRRRALRVVGG